MFVSIIVPVYNGGAAFERCMAAVQQTLYAHWECIVVDDGSTDGSAEVARACGARVIVGRPVRSGPAHARNLGARAAGGDLLFFIDADVLVQPGTVGHAVAIMQANPELAACFGSYDAAPSDSNFFSQYRNLQHHFVHQSSSNEASTFWSGCGIIRRELFNQVGGFRTLTPGRPSIEDVELGYRLKASGYPIRLEKLLQVKHMKRWTLWQMVQTDIRDRAWPWTQLIVQAGSLPNELNLQTHQRISTAAAFGGVLALAGVVWQPLLALFVVTAMLLLVLLNRPFYQFLRQKQGIGFTVRALPIHWLYFLYSGLTFVIGVIYFGLRRASRTTEQAYSLEA